MDNQIKFREFAVKFFDGKEVRTVWRDGEWWYATADALGAFADSADPAAYWRTLKRRFKKEGVQPVTVCHGLKMLAKDGKSRQVDASNEQMLLRIVQSMPSARVEHIRQWLSEVGAERLREERNPELITERAIETNKRRYGMSDAEAAQAVQATVARKQLAGLWRQRGINDPKQYAILTNVGHQVAFDVSIPEHRELKDLPKGENLRPHMTSVERALAMLQEVTEEEIINTKDLNGFYPLRNAATQSGAITAHARQKIEQATGQPVVSPFNRKRRPALFQETGIAAVAPTG